MSTVIIGGTGGIGRALALSLRERGTEVVLAARDEERLRLTATELGCRAEVCDARSFAGVEALLASVPEASALACCVGSILLKPAHLTSEAELQETLDLNLKTAFACVRAAGKLFTQGGSVLLFSSCAARVGLPNHEAIAAAKGAVEALTASAAATYVARRLRFNAIALGLVDTPLASRITSRPAALQASVAQHPLGRIGSPAEVASLAAWLLGDESSWVTGQVFVMDGGMSALRKQG